MDKNLIQLQSPVELKPEPENQTVPKIQDGSKSSPNLYGISIQDPDFDDEHLKTSGGLMFGKLRFGGLSKNFSPINIGSGSTPTTSTNGDLWHDATQKTFQYFLDGTKQSAVGCIFTQTSTTVITDTTLETTMIGSGVGSLVFPANFFVPGKTIRVHAQGYLINTSGIDRNTQIFFKFNATNFAVSYPFLVANSTASFWNMDIYTTCRSIGVTGYIQTGGLFNFQNGVAIGYIQQIGAGSTTLDTTIVNTLDIKANWEIASPSLEIDTLLLTVEILN